MVNIPAYSRNTYLVTIGDDYQREIAGTEMSYEDAAIDVAVEFTGLREVWAAWRERPALSDEDFCVQFDDDDETLLSVNVVRIKSELL